MGEPLLWSSSVFRRAVQACADALRPHGLDLMAEFGKDEGWNQPALAMVGLVAVQVRRLFNEQTCAVETVQGGIQSWEQLVLLIRWHGSSTRLCDDSNKLCDARPDVLLLTQSSHAAGHGCLWRSWVES
jgi:hypothetical protein